MRKFSKVFFSASRFATCLSVTEKSAESRFAIKCKDRTNSCNCCAVTWVPARLPGQRHFPMVLCRRPRSPWPADCCFVPWSMGKSSSWWTWFKMLKLPSIYGWKAPLSFQTSVDSFKVMFLVPLACQMPPVGCRWWHSVREKMSGYSEVPDDATYLAALPASAGIPPPYPDGTSPLLQVMKEAGTDSSIPLPDQVKSIHAWGNCVCKTDKFAKEKISYFELIHRAKTDTDVCQYLNFIKGRFGYSPGVAPNDEKIGSTGGPKESFSRDFKWTNIECTVCRMLWTSGHICGKRAWKFQHVMSKALRVPARSLTMLAWYPLPCMPEGPLVRIAGRIELCGAMGKQWRWCVLHLIGEGLHPYYNPLEYFNTIYHFRIYNIKTYYRIIIIITMSCHVMSWHVMSCHVMSHHQQHAPCLLSNVVCSTTCTMSTISTTPLATVSTFSVIRDLRGIQRSRVASSAAETSCDDFQWQNTLENIENTHLSWNVAHCRKTWQMKKWELTWPLCSNKFDSWISSETSCFGDAMILRFSSPFIMA